MRPRGCVSGVAQPLRPQTSRPCCLGWSGRTRRFSRRPPPPNSPPRGGGNLHSICTTRVRMPRVLISDKLSPAAVDIFRRRRLEVHLKPGLSPAELRAIIAPYHGLAVRSATKVTRELLDAATSLKVVGRAGIGVDNVDIRSATACGVVVMNTPHGNTITTAEHAIAMMFALARQVPQADASTRAGKWEKNRFLGVELTGKTLGVIGCGNIGSIVANRAVGLHMKVIAYDPYLSEKRAVDLGVEKAELDALL